MSQEFPNTQQEYQDISNKDWLSLDNEEVILWWENPSLIPYFKILIPPVIGILLGFAYIYFTLTGETLQYIPSEYVWYPPALVISISTATVGLEWYKIRKTFYVMTNKKIIYKKGIFGQKDTNNISFDKVQNVEFNQRFHENLLNYGDILVYTAGSSGLEQRLKYVPYPDIVTKLLYDSKQAYKEGLYD